MRALAALALTALTSLAACTSDGGPSGPATAVALGAELFRDPALSGAASNTFACATCHETASADDGARAPGGTLYGVTRRPRWWGGQVTSLLDAANTCFTTFMAAEVPLDRTSPESKSLYEYLASLGPDAPAEARPFTVVRTIAEVPRGDAARGAEVWAAACRRCHGELHTGAGRRDERAVILPEHAASYAATFPRATPALVVIEKVRHGSAFGIGGVMPLYSTEALSDAELGALLAALGL